MKNMNTKHIISFTDVSKKFCRILKKQMWYGTRDIIKNIVNIPQDSNRLKKDEFWAVKNVSFNVLRGEALGFIGHNGSGKSTILKMINGIFMPDIGEIKIAGRVGALIEVGAGFHPYLTGRENIYLNGAILGMKKKEIDEKFDEIVDFSEISQFLDMPVKNYSSGMYVRLGFSVAAHLRTDILLIDEILAVGDMDFQQKCIEKITNLKKSGTTIIFVSHNTDNLLKICDRCLFIEKGVAQKIGTSEKVVSLYLDKYRIGKNYV